MYPAMNLVGRRVLVLDGELRSALAVVRSLGRAGATVIVGSAQATCLAAASKFASTSEVYPPPATAEAHFVEAIIALCAKHRITDLIPVSEVSLGSLLKHTDQLSVNFPYVKKDIYDKAVDKYQLGVIAESLEIKFPRSILCRERKQALDGVGAFTFPVVLKPVSSRIFVAGEWLSTRVEYAADRQELMSRLEGWQFDHPFMIQEFIQGEGKGAFFLYNHGREIARFSHRRIREKPPSGGVSVLCESAPVDAQLFNQASQLLDKLQWHGVAMVEFKVSTNGTPYLMEINPRFWGSLQLAIDSGVDFPALLLAMTTQVLEPVSSYRLGVRSRWLLGDLDHLLIVWKSKQYAVSHKLTTLFSFLNFFSPGTLYDTLQIDDLRPFLYEFKLYCLEIFGLQRQ